MGLNLSCAVHMALGVVLLSGVETAMAARPIKLTGKSLPAYPFFNFVKAFNAGATVQIAVDPFQHPQIIGATADVYILSGDLDLMDGGGDPVELVDARGAPQTVTFGALGIQFNRFDLVGSDRLPAAGAGLDGSFFGTPYCIVIDVDRDGLLGEDDWIDGVGGTAGFYLVHDITAAGPRPVRFVNYSVGSVFGLPVGFQTARLCYPSDLADGEQLPLVIISHGNGHDYRWYDYLQAHLASYGYITTSHQNNVGPGIDACSLTTLGHCDAILAQQGVNPQLAEINGRIDAGRIIWIGHSRGGEGVTRAYDRIVDEPPSYRPQHFSPQAIALISSIAPTDFLGPANSNPRDRNYHLIYGAADGDVSGVPGSDIANSFNVYERATGNRNSNYFHGVGHNEFNCCGFADATGPALIGRAAAQVAARANYLAVLKFYVEGRRVAGEYLWRQQEDLRATGVGANVTEVRDFKRGADSRRFVIDDYQARPELNVSSSGGAVSTNVFGLIEGLLNDSDGTFTWALEVDPMNGMTRARPTDVTRGAVFDTGANVARVMEWEVTPAHRDLRGQEYLSFRACQQTRAPATVAFLGDTAWRVYLRDGAGRSSLSVPFNVYGGGIEEPYQRGGSGSGLGWQNEFETVRIRLTDFLTNNPNPPDLSNIVAIRMVWGNNISVISERIGLDDLEFTPE